MSKLILTRHGQSVWNAENRFTGWVDVELSKQGILEARKSGLLIKNAIVLVDQMDMEIRQGKPAYNAIIDSANSRVRPVMMGTLTTVLGVIPLYFDAFFQFASVALLLANSVYLL